MLILCFALLAGCGGKKMNQSIPNKSFKVKTFLDAQTSKSDIPGIQYILMDSNRIIFEYSGGWADIKNQISMKPGTTMMAFSMTKTITAAAVLQLIEKGKLSFDDSIDKYIPNNPYGENITIRHLLSQTSGIPNPIPLKWVHLAESHEEYDEDAALAKVLKKIQNLPLSRAGNMPIQIFLIGFWARLLKK